MSSDYARMRADVMAAAASEGLLTTWTLHEGYGRIWRPTAAGLLFLEEVVQ